MSRTIRRKNAHWQHFYVKPLGQIDQWDIRQWKASSAEHCQQRQNAWFHGDSRSGVWCTPSFFRAERNGRVKRANKHALHRCQAQDAWDSHVPIYHVKDAGYIWF